MRTPFTVYIRTATTSDEFNSKTLSYLTAGQIVWGYIQGQSAGETMEKRGMTHERSFTIMCRAQDEQWLTPSNRLVGDAMTLEIISVLRVDDRQQTITLTVQEAT
jgi:head-tail adaptor